MSAPRFKLPRPGVCRVCGCTNRQACPGGCWWVGETGARPPPRDTVMETLCSTCSGTPADLAHAAAWVVKILAAIGRHPMIIQARSPEEILRNALQRFRARPENKMGGER